MKLSQIIQSKPANILGKKNATTAFIVPPEGSYTPGLETTQDTKNEAVTELVRLLKHNVKNQSTHHYRRANDNSILHLCYDCGWKYYHVYFNQDGSIRRISGCIFEDEYDHLSSSKALNKMCEDLHMYNECT